MQIDALRAGSPFVSSATTGTAGGGDFSALLAQVESAAKTPEKGHLLASAHAAPAFARQFTHDLVYDSDMPAINITGMDPLTGLGARYAVSGELVTPESEAWHNAVARQARGRRARDALRSTSRNRRAARRLPRSLIASSATWKPSPSAISST